MLEVGFVSVSVAYHTSSSRLGQVVEAISGVKC